MSRQPAGKRARTSQQSTAKQTTQPTSSSEPPLAPPVSTSPAPTEDDVFPQLPDLPTDSEEPEEIDWRYRREVYRLPNGATIIARNEIEAGAYSTHGGQLVDVITDK